VGSLRVGLGESQPTTSRALAESRAVGGSERARTDLCADTSVTLSGEEATVAVIDNTTGKTLLSCKVVSGGHSCSGPTALALRLPATTSRSRSRPLADAATGRPDGGSGSATRPAEQLAERRLGALCLRARGTSGAFHPRDEGSRPVTVISPLTAAQWLQGGLASEVDNGQHPTRAAPRGCEPSRCTLFMACAQECDEGGPPRWQAPFVTENEPEEARTQCCTLDWI
jgi:hypothetical protein